MTVVAPKPRRRIPERFVSVLDQGISSLSNFVVVIAVASATTVTEFGVFTLAYAVLIFALGAQRALIGETLIVRYSKMHRIPRQIISVTFGASIAYTVIFAVGIGVVAAILQSPLWAMLAIATLPILVQDIQRYTFIAMRRSRSALTLDTVWLAITIPLILVSLWLGLGGVAVVASWAIGAFISLLVGLWLLRAAPAIIAGVRWVIRLREFSFRYFGEYSALNASNLLVWFLLVFPIGAAGVGALRGIFTLFSPLNTLFNSISFAIVPELTRQKDPKQFRKRFVEAAALLLGLALVWTVVVAILPDNLGVLVLGDTWLEISGLELPTGVQYIFLALYILVLALFRARTLNRQSTIMRVVFAIVTLGLPIGLAFTWGTVGAAWGFAFATVVASATGLILTRMNRRAQPATKGGDR